MNQPLVFALLGAGGLLLVSAVTGSSLADVISGRAGSVSHTGRTLAGGVAGVGQAVSQILPTAGRGTVVGDVTWGELNSIAAQHGWNSSEVQAWARVIQAESNGTTTDTNPTSGAYGIAQFINGPGEYARYGGSADTVTGQLTAMANYIAQRYGTPTAAWVFHVNHGWY